MIPLSPCHKNAPGMISRWNRLWLALLLTLLPFPVASQADSTTLQVVRVIDGDTIQVCCMFGDRVTISVSPTGSQGARGLLPEGFPPRDATALRRRTC